MAVVRYIGDSDRGRATRSTFKQVTRSMFKQANRSTFKQIHNNITAEDKTRVSKRLRMRKKQKGGGHKERHAWDRTVDYTQKPIEYGNPAQKLLFLISLGLVPKEGVLMPPYVVLKPLGKSMISAATAGNKQRADSMESKKLENLPGVTKGLRRSGRLNLCEGHACSCSDSDIEDLDLELLIYPVDIPEFVEDIERRWKESSNKAESRQTSQQQAQKEAARRHTTTTSAQQQQSVRRKSPRLTEQQRKAQLPSKNDHHSVDTRSRGLRLCSVETLLLDLT